MKQVNKMNRPVKKNAITIAILCAAVASTSAVAAGVSFSNAAANGDKGIAFDHIGAPSEAVWEEYMQPGKVFNSAVDGSTMPFKSRGAPGVAVFDYDNDGDQDIYVSNGIGGNNGLYANQLAQTGELSFNNVSTDAGVAAVMSNSSGVCFGDIDNDGDQDLVVLATDMTNSYFENQGNGTFVDKSQASGIANKVTTSTTCSMGDINGDGLLDIAVANTWDSWDTQEPLVSFNNDHKLDYNQLFVNQGGGKFVDEAKERGVNDIAGISWSISLVDYDLDGDADLIVADDQGPRAPAKEGGEDRGFIRIYQNDSMGQFTNITTQAGMVDFGAYMSLAFADFNHDGTLDVFATNVGDFLALFTAPMLNFFVDRGEWASTWFLQDQAGKFSKADVGGLIATPFGWGSAAVDYDNDADTDIIYHGGESMGIFIDSSNPGVILSNDGQANFSYDNALAKSADHSRRNVEGVAVGDLNNDGFADVVSVSSFNWGAESILMPYLSEDLQSPFDATAFMAPSFAPIDGNPANGFQWTGMPLENGDLTVDINSGNDNKWIKVNVKGTVGLVEQGKVNRDGLGAILKVTPTFGETAIVPVASGGSYASSHALEKTFGLGNSFAANVDVLWPGGVKNKYFFARPGRTLNLPEIPCSYDDMSMSYSDYRACVNGSLISLRDQGVITRLEYVKLAVSAYHARIAATAAM